MGGPKSSGSESLTRLLAKNGGGGIVNGPIENKERGDMKGEMAKTKMNSSDVYDLFMVRRMGWGL